MEYRRWFFGSAAAITAAAVAVLIVNTPAYAAGVSCGDTITADTTLTQDVTACPGDGLIIGADNVTLDLNGHVISGGGTGEGVRVEHSGATIRNGTISEFSTGLKLASLPSGSTLNATGLTVDANGNGIVASDGFTHVSVTGSVISGNSDYGLVAGDRVALSASDNTIDFNGAGGLLLLAHADGSRIEHNIVFGNGGTGIAIGYSNSYVVGNTLSGNAGYGLRIDDFQSFANSYTVAANVAYGNADSGLYLNWLNDMRPPPIIDYGADAGGNIATANGEPQCNNLDCSAALPVTLGTEKLAPGVDTNRAGQAEAFSSKAQGDGTASSIALYVDASSTATQLRVGIYSDSDNHPDVLLGEGTLPGAPIAGAWNTISLPHVPLADGVRYWIALLTPVGGGQIRFRDYCCGYDGPRPSETSRQTTLAQLPAVWQKGTRYRGDGPLSAWVGSSLGG